MPRPPARDRLLDCAEQLFAEHGLAGVSLRSINAAAGLSPAALHYHFGSQQALVEALLERRMERPMARRRDLLDALEKAPAPPSARDVVAALVLPMAELLTADGEGGRRYIRLLARLRADGDLDERFVVARYSEGVQRLEGLLQRALPDVPAVLVRLRLAFVIELILPALAGWQTLAGEGAPGEAPLSLDALVASLLDFLVGALEAPVTHGVPRVGADPSSPSLAGGPPVGASR